MRRLWQAALAFEQHEVGPEGPGGSQHDLRAIGNDLAPESPTRVAHWNGHEPECAPAGIRSNVKQTVSRIRSQPRVMLRVIFMIVFARSDEFEFFARLIGPQVADFAGRMTGDVQKKKSTAGVRSTSIRKRSSVSS